MNEVNTIICKKCGVAAGYYKIIHYHGVGEYHMFDDGTTEIRTRDPYEPSRSMDNGSFYNSATWSEGKTKYCNNCRAKRPSVKDLKKYE